MSPRHALDLRAAPGATLTPEQKRFQTLMARIAKARERLAAWQREAPVFARKHAERAAPRLEQLAQARRTWAFDLETLVGARRWSKADRACLSEMILEQCDALLAAGAEADAELKALYNRHAEVDFDEDEQQHLASMKELVEKVGGIELGDEAFGSVDEMMDRAREQMARQAAAPPPQPAGRRKAKSATQRRAEEDHQRISQSVREVYRKLASALHPDRADAELPEAARRERTALMQRANVAYEAGDLLALLELQLHIEQIDADSVQRLVGERVRHFNKVLAEQLRELEAEIDARQIAFCEGYGLLTERRLDPTRLDDLLRDELQHIERVQMRLSHDRRLLERGDTVQVRQFLRHWRHEQRLAGMDHLVF